jgi:Ca-activated chloride channel family protein
MKPDSVSKSLVLGVALSCACNPAGLPPGTATQPPTTEERGETPSDSEDVLPLFQEMNGDKFPAPPKNFRHGNVHALELPKQAVQKTPTGFIVTLPSGAPVTTPAAYKGKVYVSGGFRSHEFYALDSKTGKAAWGLGLDDDGPSSPACEDDTCVFGTESCTVFAVDANSGKLRWSYWLGDPMTSAPAIAGSRVFVSYPADGAATRPPSASHVLAAFDLKKGTVVWQRWIDADVMSAPVATGEFVYVATFAGTLLKIYQASGRIKYAIRARATSAPVVLHAGEGKRESLFYTRRVDGEPGAGDSKGSSKKPLEAIIYQYDNKPVTKYKANSKGASYLDDAVQSGSDYAVQGQSDDSANGFSGGAPSSANAESAKGNIGQASVSTLQAFQGSRVLHLGTRNFSTMGDEVVAIDASSGDKLWSYKLAGDLAKEGGALGTAPLAAGGSVLVAMLNGKVVRMDSATGKVSKAYSVPGRIRAQPIVSGGYIYVGTENGRLVAIDTKDATLTGWPMWGANAARTGVVLGGE